MRKTPVPRKGRRGVRGAIGLLKYIWLNVSRRNPRPPKGGMGGACLARGRSLDCATREHGGRPGQGHGPVDRRPTGRGALALLACGAGAFALVQHCATLAVTNRAAQPPIRPRCETGSRAAGHTRSRAFHVPRRFAYTPGCVCSENRFRLIRSCSVILTSALNLSTHLAKVLNL